MSRALWLGALISSAVFAQTAPPLEPSPAPVEPSRRVTVIDFEDGDVDLPLWDVDFGCPGPAHLRRPSRLVRVREEFREPALDALPAR